MSQRAKSHLHKLRDADQSHLLQAVLLAHVQSPDDLDLRISLLGAMHHAGWKSNQVGPYLRDWDPEPSVWIGRCLARNLANFNGDPLATSALIYFEARNIIEGARESFPHLVYAKVDEEADPRHRIILASEWKPRGGAGRFAHRCLELLWLDEDLTPDECHYAKAIMSDAPGDYLHGKCGYTAWSTAQLPHGHWYVPHNDVDLGGLADVSAAALRLPDWAS